MSTPKARGPYAKSAERQASIAAAALEIVRESGHQSMTTAEVASRAGVSERTLFYHFPTRDHVLVAVLQRIDELSQAEALAAYGPDPKDGLDEVIDLILGSIAGESWKAALSVSLNGQAQDPTHPAHDYFVGHYERAVHGFVQLLRARQEVGLAHPELDVVSVARRVVAVWDGLQAMWLVTPDFDLRAEVAAAFRQLSGENVMEYRQALDDLAAGF